MYETRDAGGKAGARLWTGCRIARNFLDTKSTVQSYPSRPTGFVACDDVQSDRQAFTGKNRLLPNRYQMKWIFELPYQNFKYNLTKTRKNFRYTISY